MTSPDPVKSDLPSVHPACMAPDLLLKECIIQHVRRSGPGGQHRNKVETGVVIKHLPTQITGEASEKRQQGRNRAVAIFRLRVNLAIDDRTNVIIETPSTLWKSRLSNGTLKINPEHTDFPALLAEAMDVVTQMQFDIKQSSHLLQCSSSQLIKFLKKEPRAISLINQKRTDLGLHPFK